MMHYLISVLYEFTPYNRGTSMVRRFLLVGKAQKSSIYGLTKLFAPALPSSCRLKHFLSSHDILRAEYCF